MQFQKSTILATAFIAAFNMNDHTAWSIDKVQSDSDESIVQKLKESIGSISKSVDIARKPEDNIGNNKTIKAYLFKLARYQDLLKARETLKDTGFDVFVCSIERWSPNAKESSTAPYLTDNSYSAIAIEKLSPGQAIRLLSGPPTMEYGVTSEDVASLLDKWSEKYKFRIDAISDNGVDIEFLEHPKNLKGLFKNLADFDPKLIGVDNSQTQLFSKRVQEMIDYFKKSNTISLAWE